MTTTLQTIISYWHSIIVSTTHHAISMQTDVTVEEKEPMMLNVIASMCVFCAGINHFHNLQMSKSSNEYLISAHLIFILRSSYECT